MRTIFITKKKIYIGIFIILMLILGLIVGIKLDVKEAMALKFNEVKAVITENLNEEIPEPIYHGNTDNKNISFAINVDWGEEYIPKMLDIFAEEQIQSTFFLTGRWCEKNPDLAKEIAARGHELGNHAYSHKSPNTMSEEENIAEIRKTNDVIFKTAGVNPVLYAPPAGERKDQVLKAAKNCSMPVILWTVDTVDWKKPEPEKIIAKVLKNAGNGSIILMHPTKNTVEALPSIIKELKKSGFNLVNVSTNMGN